MFTGRENLHDGVGWNYLQIMLYTHGESVTINTKPGAKTAPKDNHLIKENDALKKDVAQLRSELTAKTTKLDSCMTFIDAEKKKYTEWSDGSSTEAPLNMVETDFSVQNSDDFSVKNSNTRDIVDAGLVGLVAVLTSVVAYQYKGI